MAFRVIYPVIDRAPRITMDDYQISSSENTVIISCDSLPQPVTFLVCIRVFSAGEIGRHGSSETVSELLDEILGWERPLYNESRFMIHDAVEEGHLHVFVQPTGVDEVDGLVPLYSHLVNPGWTSLIWVIPVSSPMRRVTNIRTNEPTLSLPSHLLFRSIGSPTMTQRTREKQLKGRPDHHNRRMYEAVFGLELSLGFHFDKLYVDAPGKFNWRDAFKMDPREG